MLNVEITFPEVKKIIITVECSVVKSVAVFHTLRNLILEAS